MADKGGLTFLSKARILAQEIYDDSIAYLGTVYKSAGFVFRSSSPFGQILKVQSEISELIMFYLEDSVVEQNIETATNLVSIYGLAAFTGHNPTRQIAARGEIQFKFKPGKEGDFPGPYILLNNNTKLTCNNNNQTYTVTFNSDSIRVNKGDVDFINASIIQGEFESQTVIGTGLSMQSFNINVNDADQNEVRVFVNGVLWRKYDSLYDMPNGDTEGVIVRTGIGGGIDLFFGNGRFGKVPVLGAEIKVEYLKTVGRYGVLDTEAADVTFEWSDDGFDVLGEEVDLNEFLTVETVKSPKFGSDSEDPNFTKLIAPRASKSFVLGHPDNYEYFLSRYTTLSYINAYHTVDDEYLDDDNIIYLFLLPDIERKMTSDVDYFNMDVDDMVLTAEDQAALKTVINESGQQAANTEISFVDPVIKNYAITVVLRYYDTFEGNEDIIRDEIRSLLSEYFTNVKRRDRLPKSDLVAIIENVEGVDSVNVYFTSQENEEAIRNGYYVTELYKVVPTIPFLRSDEGPKKRFVFFKKEKIEKKVNLTEGENPNLGLDEFGDIKIGNNELPVIRGGWYDREGTYIEDVPTDGKPSSLSIYFKEMIRETPNVRAQNEKRKKLT